MVRQRDEIPQAMGMPKPTKDDLLTPDIMQQTSVAHSALRSAEKALLASYLDHYVAHAIEQGGASATQARREFSELFYRYIR